MKKMMMIRTGKNGHGRMGATVVEYALVILLIFLATYSGIKTMGEKSAAQFTTATSKLAGSGNGGGAQ